MSQHIYFGENFPDHLPESERAALGHFLFTLSKHDVEIGVRRGREALRPTGDMAAVASAIGHTDTTQLDVHRGNRWMGTVRLEHGQPDPFAAVFAPEGSQKLVGLVDAALARERGAGMADAELIRELTTNLGQLLEQVYQMQDMFDDEDGAIRNAVESAEEAEAHGQAFLSALRAA